MRISDWSSDVCSSDLLETEQPSVRRPKAAPRPANQVTPPNTTPASRERQGPRTPPDRPVSDQPVLALPVAASPLPARLNVAMPLPAPALSPAASSTVSTATEKIGRAHV